MPTITITANKIGTYYDGSWIESNDCRQGYYANTGHRIYFGHFFFPDTVDGTDNDLTELRAAMSASDVIVDSIQLYFYRTNTVHGAGSATPVKVYCSALTGLSGSGSSSGNRSNGQTIGSFNRGEGKWCTVPRTHLDHLLAGNNGFVLYHDSVDNYASDYSYYVRTGNNPPKFRVTYRYGSSLGTLDKSSATLGDTVSLSITAQDVTYSHSITWNIGSLSVTHTIPASGTTTSYADSLALAASPTGTGDSLDWITQIPNDTSGVFNVTLNTVQADGTVIGTKVYNFTLNVPSTILPTIGSFTITRNNPGNIPWSGIYVQGKNTATLTISGAAGIRGSTIVSQSISGAGFGSSTSTLTTGLITQTGSITFTATVTDSRGRSKTATQTITVYDYTSPVFTSITAFRCDSVGTALNSGTYISVKASFSYSSVNGNNTPTCTMLCRQGTSGSYTLYATTLTSGTAVIIGGGNVNIQYVYGLQFSLTDTYMTSTSAAAITSLAEVPSTNYALVIRNDGLGVSFGKSPTRTNAIELNKSWPIYVGDNNMSDSVLGNSIDFSNNTYLKLFVITINTAYVNAPISFRFCGRSSTGQTTFHLKFANSSTTTPDVASFTYEGSTDTYGSTAKILKYSTYYEVWMQNAETSDNSFFFDIKNPYESFKYTTPGVTVRTPSSIVTASALPTDYVSIFSCTRANIVANNLDLATPLPISEGGHNGTTLAQAQANLGIVPITYGTTDLTAGSSALTTGTIYFVYE